MRRLSRLALGITLAFSSAAFAAQADVPSNPNILQALQQLQQSVNQLQGNDTQEAALLQGIQTSLTSIQTTLQGLTPTASNVRVSAPVNAFFGETIRCSTINLAAGIRTVSIELVGNGTSVPVGTGSIPQFGSLVAAVGVTASETPYACRFTVTNGTKADITASLTQVNAAATEIVAVVPAE